MTNLHRRKKKIWVIKQIKYCIA